VTENIGPITEVFDLIALLAIKLESAPMTRWPAGWTCKVDEHWTITLNGNETPLHRDDGVAIPPFHCFAEFNGWPAGLFSPFGGLIAAGVAANEEALMAAIRARL